VEHRDRERLRTTFGSVADLYDRARPGYPAAVFDDLAALAPGSRGRSQHATASAASEAVGHAATQAPTGG